MGTVYLAENKEAGNRPCVIKQLTNKYTDPFEQSEAIRLFQREAFLLRNLDHPGIVRVFDSHATQDGRYFLVMDYVPGKNLEIMLQTGGVFSSDFAVHLFIQCCEVLEYLHDREYPIIYRDLKPSNLMLTPDGKIVFVDFGIARVFMPRQAATRVVTAGYSPPEQYFGKPETRSDLYSLGATISHLVTGKRPKPLTISIPQMINPNVHPALDNLIRRLTAQNPDERPASAKAVRYDLYKIYKEYDPAFEIPAEAHQAATDRLQVQRTLAEQAVASTNAREPEPARFSAPSFWDRFKQWWEIWLS